MQGAVVLGQHTPHEFLDAPDLSQAEPVPHFRGHLHKPVAEVPEEVSVARREAGITKSKSLSYPDFPVNFTRGVNRISRNVSQSDTSFQKRFATVADER